MAEERNNIFCQRCGAENPANAKFCHDCGSSMNITEFKTVETKGSDDSFIITLGYILSFIAVGISIVFSIYLQTRDNPNTVMHGRVQACIWGLWLIIIGEFLSTIIAIVGAAVIIVMLYMLIRDREQYQENYEVI